MEDIQIANPGARVTSRCAIYVCAILTVFLSGGVAISQEAVPPRAVKVLPVFFVPKDERGPTDDQTGRLMRHLEWCRSRYREMLGSQITFFVAQPKPYVYQSSRDLAFYRQQPESSAPQVVSELLTELKFTRYNCPYVLLVVMMNSKDEFPFGGARPLNGGYNTGGGIVVLSSFGLDRSPNFQSTLQHELGHAFGLTHVDVYGYNMQSSDSIMSYNPKHHTNWFTSSQTPGKLTTMEFYGLSLNQRAFPGVQFEPKKDDPPVSAIMARIVCLGPMKIPGQPDGVKVTTDSGQEYGSKVSNVVQGRIKPSEKTGKVTFDPNSMWHSSKTPTGWVSLQITFPYDVELTRVAIHSEHSGQYNAVHAARFSVQGADQEYRAVADKELKTPNDTIALPKTNGRTWRLDLQAGESKMVTLRGLQFFSGDDELFPPLVPCLP